MADRVDVFIEILHKQIREEMRKFYPPMSGQDERAVWSKLDDMLENTKRALRAYDEEEAELEAQLHKEALDAAYGSHGQG